MNGQVVGKRARPARLVVCLAVVGAVVVLGASAALAQVGQNVTAIEVQGTKVIPAETVLAVIKTQVGDKLTQEAVKADLKSIMSLGLFGDARARFVNYLGGVRVVFEVAEYPRIKEILFEGNTAVKSEELAALMSVQVGEVLNANKLRSDIERVQKFYLDKGFAVGFGDTDISAEGVITVRLVEMTVSEIRVEGNQKTKARVIQREIVTQPGDLVNLNKLRTDQRRIYNMGIFEDVNVKVDPVPDKPHCIITFVVKERKSGTMSLGVTYSTADGLLGYIEVAEDNFLGNHQRVNLRWEFGGKKSNYELGFFEPWLDKHHTSFGFNVFNRTYERERGKTADDVVDPDVDKVKFTEHRRGGSVTIGRPLSLNARAYATIKVEEADYAAITEGADLPEGGSTHSLILSALNDTRDNFVNPMNGGRQRVSAEFAGGVLGGDWDFSKYDADVAKYVPAGETQVWALRLGGGYGLGELPQHELYRVGGSETVRGYRYGEFIGDKMLYGNAEYRFRIVKGLQGVVFLDAGDAWKAGEDSKFHVGAGVGLRIETPIALLRIDYGVGENGGQTYFSFGQSF